MKSYVHEASIYGHFENAKCARDKKKKKRKHDNRKLNNNSFISTGMQFTVCVCTFCL